MLDPQQTQQTVRAGKAWRTAVKLHAYVGETILVVGLMYVLNLGAMPARPGFLGVEPNPYWAVILLMAARYGFRASFFAALCCSGAYFAAVAPRVGVVAARDLLAWHYAKSPLLFIVVGVIVGMLVQRIKNRVAALEQENTQLNRDKQALQDQQQELSNVNVELANRVVGATDTLPLLYKYAKKLNSLDRDEVFVSLTELVQEVIKAQQVSVYLVHGERLELHSRNGRRLKGNQLEVDRKTFEDVVHSRQVVSLHDLLDRNLPRKDLFLCGPLGPVERYAEAVLAVEQLEFLRFNPASARLFKVIIDWAASSLTQAPAAQAEPPVRQPRREPAMAARPHQPRRPATRAVEERSSAAPARAGAALGLGNLLDTASRALFDDGDAIERVEQVDLAAEVPAEDMAPLQRHESLQHLLSGELHLARRQGNQSLERLLAEIDGYLTRAE